MCRDGRKEKAKTKRGKAEVKITPGETIVLLHFAYLGHTLTRGARSAKLLRADNKASGHNAKFFICVYPHGKAD